jgi:S-adenosylmethionine synthetase
VQAGRFCFAVSVSPDEKKRRIPMRKLFTSESVTEGHPDKLCDQVSDAVLDAILAQDPQARVACETFATTGMITVMGEITTSTYVDIPAIVRKTVVDIGYDAPEKSFNGNTCAVMTAIHEQSPDIAMGVDDALETRGGVEADTGAGDQGMMFGFACNETPERMPMAIALSHRLARRLTEVRKNGTLPWLYPDGKTQVTVAYEDDKPVAVDTIVISAQHAPDVSLETIREALLKHVVTPVVPQALLSENTRFLINPTGRFVIGGPAGDTGLTGRKIIVDTYGGYAPHGGGCFSGKDPTKVDRSAAYAARHAAKNIVAAGLADRCQIQLAYAIGVAEPVSILVDTFGTGTVSEEKLSEALRQVFDFRPAAIIRDLDLRRPIYRQTAAYGHFGRTDIDLPWEREDRTEQLLAAVR